MKIKINCRIGENERFSCIVTWPLSIIPRVGEYVELSGYLDEILFTIANVYSDKIKIDEAKEIIETGEWLVKDVIYCSHETEIVMPELLLSLSIY